MTWHYCRGQCRYNCNVTNSDGRKPEFCTLKFHNSPKIRNPSHWKSKNEQRKSKFIYSTHLCTDCPGRTCQLLAADERIDEGKPWDGCPYRFDTGATWVKFNPRYEGVDE